MVALRSQIARGGLPASAPIVERFFRRRDALPATLENGFLPDPNGFMGKLRAGEVCTRADIHQTACSILLGEPGLGKSITMLQRQAELPDGSLFLNLSQLAAEEVLRAIRESNRATTHIVIDSLDEADLPSFPSRLLRELSLLPPGTLRLELACRASEWPETLERGLPQVFGEAEVSYFRLDPLRQADCASIVEPADIDPKAFLEAVYERDLGPFAAVPLTLQLLMQVFRTDKRFPQRALEIYEKALLHLCKENSPSRREAQQRTVAPSRALVIAAQLAAATVLGNRPRITPRSSLVERHGELSIERVVSGVDDADEDAIAEVLQTGLFLHHSAETASFYHHSFAEFLAAHWLHHSALSAPQLRQLLFHHEASDHLVPQLSGVAAWLSCMSSEMAALLARLAPEVFIQADSPVATDAHRAAAVEALLARAKTRSLTRYWWHDAESRRLGHPGLADQLKPYLLGADTSTLPRRKAIEIAKANGLSELAEHFVNFALDHETPDGVRVEAIEAAFACTSEPAAVTNRLRSLAEPQPERPQSDDIRAAVLSELWPKRIDAAELFRLLVRPPRGPVRGRYSSFIHRVANDLRPGDLVTALTWAGRMARPHSDGDCSEFESLSEAIFMQAWAHLHDDACRKAYAKAAWQRLKVYKPVLGGHAADDEVKQLLADADGRHQLLGEFALLATEPNDAYFLIHPHGQPPFAVEADLDWALDRRRGAEDLHKPFWEHLICRLLPVPVPQGILEAILEEVGDAQKTAMLPFPLFVEVDSPEAKEAAKQQHQHREWAEARAKREDESRSRRARAIEPGLSKAEQGDPAGWYQAVEGMLNYRLADTPRELLGAFVVEPTQDHAAARYLRLAQRYLETMPTDSQAWLREKHTVWFPARAGYLSIRLVERFDAEWWARHAPVLLARWAGAIVGFNVHALGERSDQVAHRQLVELLFQVHPLEGRRTVALLLEREAGGDPDLAALDFLPADLQIGDLLERCLSKSPKRVEAFRTIFDALVRFDAPRAIAFADRLLRVGNIVLRRFQLPLKYRSRRRTRHQTCRPRLGESRRYSAHQFSVVLRLLNVQTPEAWELVRRAALRYPRLGRDVAASFADDFHSNWGNHVDDAGLAQLLRWLPWPATTDESLDSFSPLRSFRHGLLSRLAARGTPAAVRLLADFAETDPTDAAVRGAAAEARAQYCELSWQPTEPVELFQLRRLPTARMVQSAEQLLEVVIEAIDQYAEALQGKPPAAVDLWNDTRAQSLADVEYYPKDEVALSDHLKRNLPQYLRGMVVNREVEISPTAVERGSGENVDLLVQAVCPITYRQWSVVIEVKGSWNSQLLTHLVEQLRQRYLSSNAITCGIYLVGWYACTRWSKSDRRRGATGRLVREEVAKVLTEQAIVASTNGRTVRVRMLDLTRGIGTERTKNG